MSRTHLPPWRSSPRGRASGVLYQDSPKGTGFFRRGSGKPTGVILQRMRPFWDDEVRSDGGKPALHRRQRRRDKEAARREIREETALWRCQLRTGATLGMCSESERSGRQKAPTMTIKPFATWLTSAITSLSEKLMRSSADSRAGLKNRNRKWRQE
jgi:hypothetical protein